jgi:uncharacterized integral membrane protein
MIPVAPESENQKPKRDELLAALDTEINHAETALNSSGRSRWALTLSLSALLWLGIEVAGRTDLAWRPTLLLAVALTLLWQLVLDVASAIDGPLLKGKRARGKFFQFSPLLGAVRSTILFSALKNGALLVAVLWINRPELPVAVWYLGIALIGCIIAFLFSFVKIPPLPLVELRTRYSVTRWTDSILTLLDRGLQLAAAAAVVTAVVQTQSQFHASDVRLGIILAAFGYLLTQLVEDRFPTAHLSALRTVRQNLAFERFSVEDAKKELDALLFAGGTAASTMHDSPDSLLAQANLIRSIYAQAEPLIVEFEKLTVELQATPPDDLLLKERRAEHSRLLACLVQLQRDAEAEHKVVARRVKRLEKQASVIAILSATSGRDLAPLISRLKAALEPLEKQRTRLSATLDRKSQSTRTASAS